MPKQFARFQDALIYVAGRETLPDPELINSPLVQFVAFLWQKTPENIAHRVLWIRQALPARQLGTTPEEKAAYNESVNAVIKRHTFEPDTHARTGRRRQSKKPNDGQF